MTLSLFVSAILRKMPVVGKVQEKFLIHIFTLFLSLKSRYTISNFNRYGGHSEGFYHQNLRKTFDYEKFNGILIKETAGCERFIGYDSSFLTKSGKNTPGLGRFWSGCAGAMKRGLEINCICVVDVENRTGFHYGFSQSKPSEIEKLGLYESHAAVLTSRKAALQSLAGNIVVADAFFSNKTFNDCLAAEGFILLSRMQKRTKMRKKRARVQRKNMGVKLMLKTLITNILRCFRKQQKAT